MGQMASSLFLMFLCASRNPQMINEVDGAESKMVDMEMTSRAGYPSADLGGFAGQEF